MKTFSFSLFPLLFFVNTAAAQADLRQADPFFQQQKTTYQNWLDHAGLGTTLRVQAVDVQPGELNCAPVFFLKF